MTIPTLAWPYAIALAVLLILVAVAALAACAWRWGSEFEDFRRGDADVIFHNLSSGPPGPIIRFPEDSEVFTYARHRDPATGRFVKRARGGR